jgi:O-phosphoseryl-tRNA(Cys) synthetase
MVRSAHKHEDVSAGCSLLRVRAENCNETISIITKKENEKLAGDSFGNL